MTSVPFRNRELASIDGTAVPATNDSDNIGVDMHLVVFDLDGTLLQSVGIDNDCFVAAVKEAWGLTGFSTDWASYSDATDQAIAGDLYRLQFGQEPTQPRIDHLKRIFERRLTVLLAQQSAAIALTPGAAKLLAESRMSSTFRAAIATGSWHGALLKKIESAGLNLDGIPIATADDAERRADIIRVAISRASEQYSIRGWHSITYVGDGVWDLRAALELNLRFVGIANGAVAELLRRTGAKVVLSDLQSFPMDSIDPSDVDAPAGS